MRSNAALAVWTFLALTTLPACCFGGGEPERTVLAETDLSCGATTAHVRRVHVVTNRFEGVSVTVREVAFGEGATTEADTGRLGAWRPREELPEHARSAHMTDADPAWILAMADEAEYRCLADHLAELEAIFEPGQPIVVFHAARGEVMPEFRAQRGNIDISLQLSPDGALFAQFEQGPSQTGALIGQMLREPSGRVLALAHDAILPPELPPELHEASSIVAVARDDAGRALLERFPSETRSVTMTEMLGMH